MTSPEVVLFAIQASLRLYAAGRKAYVDGTRDRALTLPLPRAPGLDTSAAVDWFTLDPVGRKIAQANRRVLWLLKQEPRTLHQEAELRQLFVVFYSENNPTAEDATPGAGSITGSELSALLEIRQWSEAEDTGRRTALQQIAGTLVNIAVDYFAHMPGAVSQNRPEGRALFTFLQVIDDVDFANTPVNDIAGDLLVAVLDSVAASPTLLSGGEKEQLFLEKVTRTLAESAKLHLANASELEKRDASAWLQLVARALVKGGADSVLSNPVLFLGVQPGAEESLAKDVGATIADLVIGEDRVTFRPLLSGEGLNTVVKAALTSVAKNPDLLKMDKQGFKNVVLAVARDLGKQPNLMTADILPEIVRLVLEKSADNMDLIWGKDFSDPGKHLLVVASQQLLEALAMEPDDGKWSPTLTKDQVLRVAEVVFDEVIDNPDWLTKRAGEASPILNVAVTAALDSLREQDGRRLSTEVGVAALQASVTAVAVRLPLLDPLPPRGQGAGKVALTAALDAIFETILDDALDTSTRWPLARNSALQTLVEVGLEKLAKIGAEQKHIDVLRTQLGHLIDGSLDLDQFASALETQLRAA